MGINKHSSKKRRVKRNAFTHGYMVEMACIGTLSSVQKRLCEMCTRLNLHSYNLHSTICEQQMLKLYCERHPYNSECIRITSTTTTTTTSTTTNAKEFEHESKSKYDT